MEIEMEYLFDHLREIMEKIRAGAVLLLDYDGTLVKITEKPELAILSLEMKGLLESLTRRFRVGIISGRPLTELKRLVGLKKVYYAGNHGFEISGPGTRLVRAEAIRTRQIIAQICKKLQKKLENIGGAVVEDKGLTASVHYRLVAPKELRALKDIFDGVVKPHRDAGRVRITKGKKVFEVRPSAEWGKGEAVLRIIDIIDPKKRFMPVYVGDDETDEDAFLSLKERGITVLVSDRQKKSQAKFFLRSVDEVKVFLYRLAKMRQRGQRTLFNIISR